ncbi:AAC(3) family N-acetyltransferase [Halobacillus mangrovi]|uniref:AAC(3) family N-acetyltransferase n=1 Tax=Halobacillus mangrovi TaxID=402384 RepID=UPI003D95A22F
MYFGLNIQSIIARKKSNKTSNHSKISIKQLKEQMVEFGINEGDTILVHSSFRHFKENAEEVVQFLKDFIGPSGNILMPTHPKLTKKDGYLFYDRESSPSTVGYLTETFRKSNNVYRSKHPFSSIAAWGKDVEYLLKDNLTLNNPLPHGVNSPYYKMAKLNGKVLCIGVAAIRRGTIRHTAEEVLDDEYLVKNLFNNYKVIVRDKKDENIYKVRALNISKSQIFIAKSKIEKDWIKNGILKKSVIDNVEVEYMNAQKCVEFMIQEAKKGNTCYPYAPKRKLDKNV